MYCRLINASWFDMAYQMAGIANFRLYTKLISITSARLSGAAR
jgi:hypothetical protein